MQKRRKRKKKRLTKCGSGATLVALFSSRSTLVRHARPLVPSMFIEHEPQMPSL